MIVIKRVLNNNAVVAKDELNRTLVALGSGIAFQQKAGHIIPKDKIEKIFYPKDEDATNSISETLSQIDPKYIELSDRIISEAITSSGKNYQMIFMYLYLIIYSLLLRELRMAF